MPLDTALAKHTPGPWLAKDRQGLHGIYDVVQETRDGDYYLAQHIGEANARLIAAAPDMCEPWLAADDKDWDHLMKMIPDSGHGQFWKTILLGHRAAIVKAIGVSQ